MKCLECGGFCETSKPSPNVAKCPCGGIRRDGGISMGANIYGDACRMEDYSAYRTQEKPKLELPREVLQAKHAETRATRSYPVLKGIPFIETTLGNSK